MNNKKIFLLVITIIIVIIISVIGGKLVFNKKVKTITNIKIFTFSYSVNMSINGNVRYEIECRDKCIALIKPYEVSEEDKQEVELNKDQLQELENILNKYEVYKWNGFKKYDKNVLDGNSFHLYIRMEDDQTVDADGYMKWPSNYSEVRGELDNFFNKLYEGDKE